MGLEPRLGSGAHAPATFVVSRYLRPGGATMTGGGANGGYTVTGPGWDSTDQDL
jgi:hypothetical protein